MKPEAAFPSYLPVDGPPWRLIDKHGSFLRGPDGSPLCFPTDAAALSYLSRHSIPLLRPTK